MLTWEELITLQQVISNYMHDGKNSEQDVNVLNHLIIRLLEKDDMKQNEIMEYVETVESVDEK